MSFIGDALNSVLSLVGLDQGEKKVPTGALETLEGEEDKAGASRARLLATAGGEAGEELLTGTTSKRKTLLGN